MALDKDFQHLGFWREGQEWTRFTILTPDLATGEQQAKATSTPHELDSYRAGGGDQAIDGDALSIRIQFIEKLSFEVPRHPGAILHRVNDVLPHVLSNLAFHPAGVA